VLSATLTFEESSPFPGGAGSTAPLVFQEKPGTQLFFFRKTSSSAQKFLKRSSLYFNKSQAALTIFQQKPGIQFFSFGNPHQLRSAGLRSHAIIENTQQSSAPPFGCGSRRWLYYSVMVALHSQVG
jgi:hypothetical protein